MNSTTKYDNVSTGAIAGFILPITASLVIYLISSGNRTLAEYYNRIISADILTHIISLCVLPNLILFLISNRLDMLRATRGILGITIFWAVLVFAVKFLI